MNSTASGIKVAIVGCGKIADGHVEQIRATGLAVVVAVCDREALMARQLSLRMDVPRHYDDVGRMLAQEQPDVVHIATPPDSHPALAALAFDAGCHVFMEKPFTLDAQSCGRVLAHAAARDRRVCVNYLYNHERPYRRLLEEHAAGALGDIVHIEVAYGYNLGGDYGSAALADPDHWVHRLPGKLFHNVLDHVVSKAVPFFSCDPGQATAQVGRMRPSSGVPAIDALPDELRFQLRAGGITMSGFISSHARPVQHIVRVYGTKASRVVDIGARTIVPVAAQTLPSAAGRLLPAWDTARAYRRNAWTNLRAFGRHEFHYFQGMRELLREFYGAVQGRNDEPIPARVILRSSLAIDQIVDAIGAATGAPTP